MNDNTQKFAIVELMGHRRFGARITEVERFGAKLMRAEILGAMADVPSVEQWVAPAALYAVTWCTEAQARAVNTRWQLQAALPMLPDVASPEPTESVASKYGPSHVGPCLCGHDGSEHHRSMICTSPLEPCYAGGCFCRCFVAPPPSALCACGHCESSHSERDARECLRLGCLCRAFAAMPDDESDPSPAPLPVGEDADMPF